MVWRFLEKLGKKTPYDSAILLLDIYPKETKLEKDTCNPIVYMYHEIFIHSSVDGHLGCFHVLIIVNSAAVNIGVHVSFFSFGFLRVYA